MFLISDLHLFHDNIVKYESSRIDKDEEYFIKTLNSVYGEIYCLGDMFFKLDEEKYIEEAKYFVKQIKNPIHLVRGNHDKYPDEVYEYIGLASVQFFIFQQNDLYTHLPLHKNIINSFKRRFPEKIVGDYIPKFIEIYENLLKDNVKFRFNFHGHLHSYVCDYLDSRYKDASCEKIDYKPKHYLEFIEVFEF